jgi:hypothetical protein
VPQPRGRLVIHPDALVDVVGIGFNPQTLLD